MEGLPRCGPLDPLSQRPGSPADAAGSAATVHLVADDRVPHMFQMDAYLVGPARFQVHPKQLAGLKSGHDPRLRASRPAIVGDRHPLPVGLGP
ncbi:MAG TPA: hypothetical protein VF151_00210, partial [Gemmatimonadales bacterium]